MFPFNFWLARFSPTVWHGRLIADKTTSVWFWFHVCTVSVETPDSGVGRIPDSSVVDQNTCRERRFARTVHNFVIKEMAESTLTYVHETERRPLPFFTLGWENSAITFVTLVDLTCGLSDWRDCSSWRTRRIRPELKHQSARTTWKRLSGRWGRGSMLAWLCRNSCSLLVRTIRFYQAVVGGCVWCRSPHCWRPFFVQHMSGSIQIFFWKNCSRFREIISCCEQRISRPFPCQNFVAIEPLD